MNTRSTSAADTVTGRSDRPPPTGGRTVTIRDGVDRTLSGGFEALPARLLAKLGGPLEPYLRWRVTRQAVPVVHECGAVVLAGYDDEPCGVEAVTDLLPLSPVGEAGALLAGRLTYDLRGIVIHTVTRRGAFDISRGRTPGRIVLAEHVCGEPVPQEWRA